MTKKLKNTVWLCSDYNGLISYMNMAKNVEEAMDTCEQVGGNQVVELPPDTIKAIIESSQEDVEEEDEDEDEEEDNSINCCPRCIESYDDTNGRRMRGDCKPSECKECGACKECEHMYDCSHFNDKK